jgi:hypothetical protein
VRRRAAEVRAASEELALKSRSVVHKLKRQGMTGADIARVLAISPQRVSQLMKSRVVEDSTRSNAGTAGERKSAGGGEAGVPEDAAARKRSA